MDAYELLRGVVAPPAIALLVAAGVALVTRRAGAVDSSRVHPS
ncbi:MAG TPA: hypothetical protein VGN59_12115 [Acidimicrobiia bacterium]|jgi:hypothetical protein